MKPVWHLTTSAAGAMAVQASTGDAGAAAVFFLGGVFIDLDHLVDYCRMLGPAEGIRALALAAVDDGLAKRFRPARLFLPLHGWEWAGLLLGAGGLARAPGLFCLGLGVFVHLVLDQWGNRFRPLGYFFLARAWNGFSASCAVRMGDGQEVEAEEVETVAVG